MDFRKYQLLTRQQQEDLSEEDRSQVIESLSKYAERTAISSAITLSVSADRLSSSSMPEVFGEKWARSFSQIRTYLLDKYKENFSALATFATRTFDYFDIKQSIIIHEYCSSTEDDELDSNGTIDSQAEEEGLAFFAHESIWHEKTPDELHRDLPLENRPPNTDMQMMYALMWFFEAAEIHQNTPKQALDLLHEASEAYRLAHGDHDWESGINLEKKEGGEDALRSVTRKANDARHKHNRMTKQKVFDWYQDNRNNFRSQDAAAEKAAKEFSISFRTAQKHIGEAAKQIRSARTE
ncbi:hypothetical protein [Uliginosibacterium sp. TH139]|uniref:hypothetical protein n=1 Tax=Uliginosibacterium sp. TH139 TaxID=2067453 RepID=UPI000C7C5D90|nr:hypothetical protein [Uliginosibacterium sp. TH139]PLK47041.1 hypothetical protein C0V76_18455 [Uliginosibacterium sp. TH139]